ncbi:acyl-CoA N-acyltransferase [Trametes maxima]|nr:acyl-CoA N-acyltransferase [Trametes maxima]
MSEAPVVREATPADLEQLVPLFIHSVDTSLPGVTFSTDPLYAPDRVYTKLQTRLSPPNLTRAYVLELASGEIVAYAIVKLSSKTANSDGKVDEATGYRTGGGQDELDMFFVKAGMGGRGYGGLLMAALQKGWTERGGLQLHTFKRNLRAIRFYEKWGFRLAAGEEALRFGLQEPIEEVVCLLRWSPTS